MTNESKEKDFNAESKENSEQKKENEHQEKTETKNSEEHNKHEDKHEKTREHNTKKNHHEEHKHNSHKHKKHEDSTINISTTSFYKGISVVLGILLIISIFTSGFGIITAKTVAGTQEKTNNPGIKTGPAETGTLTGNVPNVKFENANIKGEENAPVTIVEWSDFECPFCARFYSQTYNQIIKEYVDTGRANFVFKHFPLGFHAQAQKAAEASECAGEQGMFWEMHDVLFEKGVAGGVAGFKQYAVELGLDVEQFNSCLDSGEYAQKVKDDMAEGQANGIKGTPGFIINGELISGAQPFAAFQAAIEAAENGEAPTQAAPQVPTAPAKVNMDDLKLDGSNIKGEENAPVTIVEWSDFECPFCTRFYTETLEQIQKNFIDEGKVKFVYKHFPLGFHAQAQKAAEASECAGEQGMFWEMHDVLFEKGVAGGVAGFKQYAVELGLDVEQFNSCLDSGEYAQKVKDDMAEGQANGIKGTPGFIINGELISGAQPYAVFEQAINTALEN